MKLTYFYLGLRNREFHIPSTSSESNLVKNAAVRWHGVMLRVEFIDKLFRYLTSLISYSF